jgi:predicted ATPase/class 3 adenylate cyclase
VAEPIAIPSGTITFLFTDIEGSTKRWERAGAGMAQAVRTHERIMRGAIESHGGFVFKTVGDEFCAAFSRAEDAAAAALEAQRALAAEDFSAVDGLRVRMSLHTGDCDERERDYFGPTVNRVARLLAIAHGGQTIASAATARLLEGAGWSSTRLRDLGSHRLKDLSSLERVYQLLEPSLPQDFPALRSLGSLANNLPAQSSSFVGREREVAEITALVTAHRLVTVAGSGGAGKTRISVQVGANLTEGYGHGVWFVELASLSRESSLSAAVATAANLHVALADGDDRALLESLAATTKLLILDNCEHLTGPVATFVRSLLAGCAEMRVLCTSRQPLGVTGEVLYRLPPLALPEQNAEATLSAERAMESEAVALFVERARASGVRFELTDASAGIVAEICRRLDGLPLAIELAAARVGVLAPKQLLDRLRDRFALLTTGDGVAAPRQQTLRALIDWSYDLLDETERVVFRRLSVFSGGFTLEAAERVAAGEPAAASQILDVVARLADKSLISVDLTSDETARYRLIESIQQYARELFAADPGRAAVERRFAGCVLALMETAHAAWLTEPSASWDARWQPELDNVRSALHWSLVERHDVELGISLAATARRFWGRIAPAEGLRWILLARENLSSEAPASRRAALALAEAQVCTALEQSAQALAAAEAASESADANDLALSDWADARRIAGSSLARLNRHAEATAVLTSVVESVRGRESAQLLGYAAQDLALAHLQAGRLADARELFIEALHAFEAAVNERGVGATTVNLAEITAMSGDPAEAIRILESSRIAQRDGISRAHVASNLAGYNLALGRWAEAHRLAMQAIAQTGNPQDHVLYAAAQHVATIAVLREDVPAAARRIDAAAALIGFVDNGLAKLQRLRDPTEEEELERALGAMEKVMSAEEISRLRLQGASWGFERGMYELRNSC